MLPYQSQIHTFHRKLAEGPLEEAEAALDGFMSKDNSKLDEAMTFFMAAADFLGRRNVDNRYMFVPFGLIK